MNFGLYPGTKLTEARDQRDVCRVKVRHPSKLHPYTRP
jgi:hypothetical protein